MATTKTTMYLKFTLSTGSTYDLPIESPKTVGETADDTTTTVADIQTIGNRIVTNNVILSNGGTATALSGAYVRTITDTELSFAS